MKNIDYLASNFIGMIKKGQNILFFIFLLFTVCTPYDSDRTNVELLQGQWLMTAMYKEAQDSAYIPEYLPEDSIILSFEGNNYAEYMGESSKKLDLTFDVHNYRIILHRDSSIYDWTDIEILTKDSLVLSKVDYKWQYKKIER